MGRSFLEALSSLLSRKQRRQPSQFPHHAAAALAESTLDVESGSRDIKSPQQQSSNAEEASPFATAQACVLALKATNARPVPSAQSPTSSPSPSRPNSSRPDPSSIGTQSTRSPEASARPTSAAVRFANDTVEPASSPLRSILSSRGSRSRSGAVEGRRPSRVRMQVPESGGAPEDDRGAGLEGAVVGRSGSTTSTRSKAEGQSRALTQLASRLIAHDLNYRAELEALMAAAGGPAFPRRQLEELLARHNISLPAGRLNIVSNIYRVEGLPDAAEDMVDGLALLRDLDRAAFRRLAVGGGSGGEQSRPGTADPSRASSKKSLVPHGMLGDTSRIISLVSTQLERERSLSITAGGELLAPEHIQEVVQTMDLTAVTVPVGTRARYVPATDEPGSFKVPVWSLRAMHRRQQEREQALLGEGDTELRRLGQAGREALRRKITRRSIFQQQEIIANAVVHAARLAVAPSLRQAASNVQLSGVSLTASRQPSLDAARAGEGGLASTATPDPAGELRSEGSRRQASRPGTADATSALESRSGVGREIGVSSTAGAAAEAAICADRGYEVRVGSPRGAARPQSSGPSRTAPQRALSRASLFGNGSAVGMEGGMVVRPVIVVTSSAGAAGGKLGSAQRKVTDEQLLRSDPGDLPMAEMEEGEGQDQRGAQRPMSPTMKVQDRGRHRLKSVR